LGWPHVVPHHVLHQPDLTVAEAQPFQYGSGCFGPFFAVPEKAQPVFVKNAGFGFGDIVK